MSNSHVTHHEILEHKRGVFASRLRRTIDELDERRHAVGDAAKDVKDATLPVAFAIAGVSVAAALAYLFVSHRSRQRDRRNPLRMLARAADRMRDTRERSPAARAGAVAESALIAGAAELAKYGVRVWMESGQASAGAI